MEDDEREEREDTAGDFADACDDAVYGWSNDEDE